LSNPVDTDSRDTDSRDTVIAGLIRAWRAQRLQADILDDAAFKKLGINRTDGRCLDALSEGPMTATALAAASGVSANALTTVVDRLAERGLVERTGDTGDRRRVLIRLTALAGRLSQQLYGPAIEWSMRNFEQYTTEQLALITRFIDQGTMFQAEHVHRVRDIELSWTPDP
jgi:DNA-binding MarR family transcriptional regulator